MNNPKVAVQFLHKLLSAADRAKQEGKLLALDKVLKEAKKLTAHIKRKESDYEQSIASMNQTKKVAELQWLKIQGATKPEKPQSYKKVVGEIIE